MEVLYICRGTPRSKYCFLLLMGIKLKLDDSWAAIRSINKDQNLHLILKEVFPATKNQTKLDQHWITEGSIKLEVGEN